MTGERILVVEDDPDLRELLEFIFDREGYETVVFDHGGEAWSHLETTEELPECIVLDLFVPGADGMEILERRAEAKSIREIPVVVLTGWDSEDTVSKVFDRGADDFITKPFSANELLVRVRRLLR